MNNRTNTPNRATDAMILADLNEASKTLEKAAARVNALLGQHDPLAVVDAITTTNAKRSGPIWGRYLRGIGDIQEPFNRLVEAQRRRLGHPEAGPPPETSR